ncbi:MAG: 50S ribosomal protein L7/L12 [Candidatus Lloydbacteria bacterium RIFCSPHIGHO2_02_FULL_54_17]|uniref:Large ribosomal subunit protein bL12 n=1 Tax=Candidatus Lloydbacteria bacterium RIFCSPHIGHO2_02_FULL_54_17 TaxID=1798664 RepID=A0A1G2DBH4_9BACT|nr:MAG: 50S ribosomal protein L7/L12 [Candidatus Lloydbacteria bacterium RIFCSPHIGHO2_01_FULL_54_11]OGZ10987.1 MAG: 50S ribosomal protein L7/L12 [Candidatus Lloydbacteria bacterium RIFCSPHIGHO2_02_FULL_54_17]OGZ13138.1 MAG: 50S ribosomal protein L7/L12 [Candidatus Lloydbacteria bacterium RIFCSPLOWO2_01_FULL_54_18]
MEENKTVEVPAKFKDIVAGVEKLTLLELHELVKLLEGKWGVSATAAVAAPAGPAAPAEEEKDSFDVELAAGGATPIQIIKIVKEVLGLGLKEAKDMVDGAPAMIKQAMKKVDAEALKKRIEDAGGKVNLK